MVQRWFNHNFMTYIKKKNRRLLKIATKIVCVLVHNVSVTVASEGSHQFSVALRWLFSQPHGVYCYQEFERDWQWVPLLVFNCDCTISVGTLCIFSRSISPPCLLRSSIPTPVQVSILVLRLREFQRLNRTSQSVVKMISVIFYITLLLLPAVLLKPRGGEILLRFAHAFIRYLSSSLWCWHINIFQV